jgi:HAD superfamily hydrolase (TIGR01509 family)
MGGRQPGSRVRALIFDFDGLIIDSETPLFDIWSDIYRRRGQTLTIDDWQHALGTQGGFDPYAHLSSLLAESLDRKTLASYVSAEHWRLCGDEPLLPGVRDRIEEATASGLGLAVASSSSAAWVRPWLERHELDVRIPVICTRDDVARVKPAPDLFLLAAERLAVDANRCAVFEDSPNGIRAARAAGMLVVAVPNRLTRGLAGPDPDLTLGSLAELTLPEILDAIDASAARPATPSPPR